MNFSEFELIMEKSGVMSLADIARVLNTTPQAVSNWKARDQVPYHIVNKLNEMVDDTITQNDSMKNGNKINMHNTNQSPGFSDLLLILSRQLKLILLVPFILTFCSFFTTTDFICNFFKKKKIFKNK